MKCKADPVMSQLTTLHLGGTALMEILIENEEDLFELPQKVNENGGYSYYMGKGSNLLFRDGRLPLIIIKFAPFNPPEIVDCIGGKTIIKVGSGYRLPGLLRFCLKNSLTGLEGLCGIPGTVGGAVAMNAGSFGVEICDFLSAVEIWTGEKIKYCKIEDLRPAYRSLSFPLEDSRPVIVNAFFTLTNDKNDAIFKQMNLNFLEKKFKQPVEAWSAGCVFKNPPNAPAAGQLLDKAGFKGKKLGGLSFSTKHANFMINEGNGTATAALELLEMAKEAVLGKFGVLLEEEVKIVPEKAS